MLEYHYLVHVSVPAEERQETEVLLVLEEPRDREVFLEHRKRSELREIVEHQDLLKNQDEADSREPW